MKTVEAINVLNGEQYPNAVKEELLTVNEALDMAISALKKQIPRQPDMGHCQCGMAIDDYWEFCPNCGQRMK